MDAEKELLYFADPMCSWCWGFAPSADHLAERFAVQAPLSIIVGGLHCGTAKPLDDEARAMIAKHWTHVHEASGQPFDHAFFERETFVYDTEPACRAVVAMRRIAPAETLRMLDRLHEAFYAQNRDITAPDVLAELGAEIAGVPKAEFQEAWKCDETIDETYADFGLARELGVHGFPTLIARKADSMAVVTQGWQPLETIEPALTRWLADGD